MEWKNILLKINHVFETLACCSCIGEFSLINSKNR